MSGLNIPILRILDIIRIQRENVRQKTHNKSCYVLSCRISGEGVFIDHDTTFTVKPGDILYIPRGSSYAQECKNEEIVCFHLEAYSRLADKMLVFRSRDKENAEKRCAAFEAASDEWTKKDGQYACRSTAVLYEILSEIDIGFTESERYPPILRRAIHYLEGHLYDLDFTVEKLCRETNISRAYFNRLFKNVYGTTPTEYIHGLRIKKAEFLLDSGNYTNGEIAQLCGFGDIKYFYVVFKKVTGMTTKEYKK